MTPHEEQIQRVNRAIEIALKLQAGEVMTRSSLAASYRCTERTIDRDLALLRQVGYRFHPDQKRHSYVLDQVPESHTIKLLLPEILALAIAQQAVIGQKGIPFEAHIRSAFHKITASLPQKIRSQLQAAQEAITFQYGTRRDYSQAPLDQLVQAKEHCETVEMVYHTMSRDEISIRRVDPYRIVKLDSYYHLIGYCHQRREVRQFGLDNIRTLRLTGEKFTMPADFNPDEYLRESVAMLRGESTAITVRFEPAVARWAKRRIWGFPHHLKDEEDGSLILHGQVSGLEEIRAELLRWGAKVTVLEPPALRDMVLSEARAIAAKYEDPKK